MSVTVKRYPNRKLYNTETKRYITLDGIAGLIRKGDEVQILDHTSGEDLTTLTLSQIIFEQEKKSSGFLSKSVLTNLIQAGSETLDTVRRNVLSPIEEILTPVEQEIDRRLQELMRHGELAREEGQRMRDKLLGMTPLKGMTPKAETVEPVKTEAQTPTAEDIQTLHSQIDALTEKVNHLIDAQQIAAVKDAAE